MILDGDWNTTIRFANGETRELKSRVPGNFELDLYHGGLIADPYVGMNARELRRYEFCDWLMTRDFDFHPEAGRRYQLVCEGVDTIAEIRLNGEVLGRCENAFIAHCFEIDGALVDGTNRLEVEIFSAAAAAAAATRLEPGDYSFLLRNYESLRIRKPAHEWGWDIAPRMALGGIFRSVRMEAVPEDEIIDCLLAADRVSEEEAKLVCHYNLRLADPELAGYELEISGRCGDSGFQRREVVTFTSGVMRFTVAHPRLWWPRDWGEPALYEVVCKLRRNGVTAAEHRFNFGIRTVELFHRDLATELPEADFQFLVNGRPLHIHGCNHVPLDALHSRDSGRLEQFFQLVNESGVNMLRVWGGGVYESEEFYDCCDRFGILVWQDFMLGCAIYPQDDEFAAVIRSEAEAVVRRLRRHPSIALWAGDNECDQVWCHGAMRRDPNGNRINRQVIREVVERLDPRRPYLPSSPYVAPDAYAVAVERGVSPDLATPEQHLWGPRNYFKSDFYRHTSASFVSEIGYHGCPDPESIRSFISPERLWPWRNNPEWDYHASNPWYGIDDTLNYRTSLMAEQMREFFGFIPENLEDFAQASQFCQAEAKKYFIEMIRGAKPAMSGVIWWNLLDCWPQFSDAVVDYYFRRKAAFDYIRRSQAPFVVLIGEAVGWKYPVRAINDRLTPEVGKLTIRDFDGGETLLERRFEVEGNGEKTLGELPASSTSQRLLLLEWELDSGRRGGNHYLTGLPPYDFVRYRDLYHPAICALG